MSMPSYNQVSDNYESGSTSNPNMDNPFSCFTICNNSYIEVRDCHIRSVLDTELLYSELDDFIAHTFREYIASTGESDQIKQDFYDHIRQKDDLRPDTCFTLNFCSKVQDYAGLVSLSNTTISAFTSALYCG